MTWSILIRCNIITDNYENKEFFKVSIFLKTIYSKVLRVILHYFTAISARPPESYTEELYNQKREKVYQHIYESYADAQHNIYRQAA